MKGGVAVCVLLVLAMAQLSHGAVTCSQVSQSLGQCVPYLTGTANKPAPACCAGIRSVRGQLATQSDRQQACNCIKQAANSIKGIKDEAVKNVAGACQSPLPFPVSRNMDCSKIP